MHESALLLMDMAAEGRGHTIVTRALQLVIGYYENFSGIQATLTSFLFRNGRRKVFSPPLVFLPFPF